MINKVQLINLLSKTNRADNQKTKNNINSYQINYQNQTKKSFTAISPELLQVYSGVNFSGCKTNYKWMLSAAAGYVPLVITAGLDMTKSISKPAFPNLDSNGGDWSNVNMENVYLKNAKLTNSNFKSTSMANVKLHYSDLSNSVFDRVNALRGKFLYSNFSNTKLENSEFVGANFQKADFKNSIIKNSNFSNANFLGANLSEVLSIDDDSIFVGSIYDSDTRFPTGFDPESRGMIKLKDIGNISAIGKNSKSIFSGIVIKPYSGEFQYNLSNADYSGSDMQEGKFDSVEFISSNFEDTIARGAIFIDCDFSKCKFNEKSDFSNVSFNNSIFYDTKFNGANLKRCNFIGADLSNSDFAELPDSNITDCIYDYSTSFPEGYNPIEHGLILVGHNANLSEYDFSHAVMRNLFLDDQYNFQGKCFRRADFSGSKMNKVIFKDCRMKEMCLKEVEMQSADFEGAYLYGANLTGGNFKNANFKNADLSWANLAGANLEGADFVGAKYTKGTKFPEDFEPNKYGMIEIPLKENSKGDINENICYAKL